MVDFAMCFNKDCTRTKTCRRHEDSGTVGGALRQAYMVFRLNADGSCDSYTPTFEIEEVDEDV